MLQLLIRVFLDLFLADIIGYLLVFLIIFHMAHAEERSIWEGALVLDNVTFGWWNGTSPRENLLFGTFKELVHTASVLPDQWITIDQGKAVRLSRIYI